MFSLVETIGMHQLESDFNFSKQMFEDLNDDECFEHLINEAIERLEKRLYLAKIVMKAQEKVGSKMLNITDDRVWENVKFMNICNVQLKKKLENQNNKKKFIQAFRDQGDDRMTYFDFDDLITKDMGITEVKEWEREEFYSSVDRLGLAFIELNDLA
jgi:hypothetical protein